MLIFSLSTFAPVKMASKDLVMNERKKNLFFKMSVHYAFMCFSTIPQSIQLLIILLISLVFSRSSALFNCLQTVLLYKSSGNAVNFKELSFDYILDYTVSIMMHV